MADALDSGSSGSNTVQVQVLLSAPEKMRPVERLVFLYKENHSLGEWFKRRLLPIMRTRKTPFARIEVRSGNCTKKQREVTQNERQ